MRNDTIEIPATLWDSPRVMRLAALLQQSEPATIGYLYRFWGLCSEYAKTSSPFLRVATLGYLDRTTALTGFGEAMLRIGAIEQSEDGLKLLWNPKNPTATPQTL